MGKRIEYEGLGDILGELIMIGGIQRNLVLDKTHNLVASLEELSKPSSCVVKQLKERNPVFCNRRNHRGSTKS